MGTRKLTRETTAALEKAGFKVEHTTVANNAHIAYYTHINGRIHRLLGASSPSDEQAAINTVVQHARRVARAGAPAEGADAGHAG